MELPAKHKRRRRHAEVADVVALSVPKSGRTWVRFFLGKYIEKLYGADFSLDFIPDESWDEKRRGLPVPTIDFSHNFFDFFQESDDLPRLIDSDIIARKRLVLLVRDPRDVAVSYFHHKRDKEKLFTGGLDDFVHSDIYGIERQSRFVLMMLDMFETHAGPKHFLTYEDLHRDTRKTFRDCLDFIFLSEIDEEAYAYALEESRFDNMRRNEIEASKSATGFHRLATPDWSGDWNALKVRAGKVSGYRSEMSEKLQKEALVLPFTGRLIERLNRRKNR
jgi:hypothetical protein